MAPGQRQLDGGRCYVPRSDRRGFAVWQGDQLTAAAAFYLDRDGQRQHAVAYLQDVLLAGLLDADVVADSIPGVRRFAASLSVGNSPIFDCRQK